MGIWNEVAATIKQSDIVIEVIDARCPNETRSEKLEALVKKLEKDLIIVVSKADLVPKSFMGRVKRAMSKIAPTVFIDSPRKRGTNYIRQNIMRFAGDRKHVKVSVVGYPNTGKSSMINAVKGRKSASTAPVPGHTKGMQWIRVSPKVLMLDTPGVIPARDDMNVAKGFAKPEKLKDPVGAAISLLEKIYEADNGNLRTLYRIAIRAQPEEYLEALAVNRKAYRRHGLPDTERVAKQIIQDWNSGKLRSWWL